MPIVVYVQWYRSCANHNVIWVSGELWSCSSQRSFAEKPRWWLVFENFPFNIPRMLVNLFLYLFFTFMIHLCLTNYLIALLIIIWQVRFKVFCRQTHHKPFFVPLQDNLFPSILNSSVLRWNLSPLRINKGSGHTTFQRQINYVLMSMGVQTAEIIEIDVNWNKKPAEIFYYLPIQK